MITPNGDGEDDSYFFQQTGILKVYNKNGEIVKTLTLPSVWDGSGNDGTATPGYYVGEINGGTEKVRISILH